MKVKAVVSFSGSVTMHKGQEREVSEKAGHDLIAAGYAEPLEESAKAKTARGDKP